MSDHEGMKRPVR